MVWISGEISNLRIPSSGHAYFTLKDAHAQIAAIMFRGQLRQLKFNLDDGIAIIGLGRISIYEPRGTYQIVIEYIEPKSAGALQLAFEQLKRKLAQEGLFDVAHKRMIPFFPESVCIVTSPTGAVIHDMLHILDRRCRGISVEILPVRVQGEGADADIAHAIEIANRRAHAQVILLARGGGSLEDLSAFNSERLARAIFASSIPIISAIGHETDFTITDFVADMRAPTPSAAAELIVPVKSELQARFMDLQRRCLANMNRIVDHYRSRLSQLRRSLVHPRKRVQELQHHTDELTERMHRTVKNLMRQRKIHKEGLLHKLLVYNPIHYLNRNKSQLEMLNIKMRQLMRNKLSDSKADLARKHSSLIALSPQAVLQRGYSITRNPHDHTVVTHAETILVGQTLEILLYKGKLNVVVDSGGE